VSKYKKSIDKILRQEAAFGGTMGRDGRRQYGGGSDMGQVADSSGNTGPGTGGYQGGPPGGYGDAGSNNKPSPATRKKEKVKYEKQFGGVSPTGSRPRTFFDRINTYNKNYRTKLVNKQITKKKQALRNFIASKYTQNPHMDIDEIMEGITGSYDYDNNTFGTYDFTSGLNKGKTFDLSKYGIGTQLGPFGLSPNKKFGDKGKLGTNYLDTTPDFTSHPSTMPSVMGQILGKVSPMNMNTLKSTLNRMNQLETMKASGVTQDKIDDYYDRGQGKGKYDIFGGGGNNNQPFMPIDYNTGAATVEAVEPYTNDFAYRFGNNQNVGRDVTRGYAADGGIMGTRARKAFGGIMDRVTGRKAYGLGSIFKSVGKAVKGVAKAAGKVLKSDVGKMALMAAGTYYLGGGQAFGGNAMFGKKFGSDFALKNLAKRKGFSLLTNDKGGFNPFKVAGLFATAAPFLGIGTKAKPNEDIGMRERGGPLLNSQGDGSQGSIAQEIQEAYADGDSEKIAQLQKYYNYMLPIPSAVQELGLPSSAQRIPYQEFGSQGYRTTVATGGRIGFNNGGGFSENDLYLLKKFKYDPKEVATHKDGGKGLINSLKTVGYNMGGRINKAEGGLMDLGGMEKDYRNDGGFVPIGEYEKKDDVPARLSVNEFVFTADAVRGAGGGDIDKGAEIMENVMKNLEDGGQMSKESQGNTGAQEMFSVSQRLGEVL